MSAHVTVQTVTIECTDAKIAARFWRDFLGYVVKANHTSSVHLQDPNGLGPDLLLAWADDEKAGKNRIHLDLRPDDQDVAVARALTLGATRADIGQTGNESWVVLRDPAGNEFCLLQSTSDLVTWEATARPPRAPDLDT